MMFKKTKKKEDVEILILSLILIVLIFGIFIFFRNRNKKNKQFEVFHKVVAEKKNSFQGVSLEAKSAFVWDAKENKVLFKKNGETQLPLASLTKLMTALVSSETVPSNTIITISRPDIKTEGDSGFLVGEKWTLKNLLAFTLVTSSNDGAHAIASVVGAIDQEKNSTSTRPVLKGRSEFIYQMNQKAKKLKLRQTYFLNESGLDLNKKISGAYGSAKDIAMLMANIIKNKPEILSPTTYPDIKVDSKEFVHNGENTNQDVKLIPGIIGSKTGFTDLAGGNLVVAFDIGINHPIIVSVLGSTREGRFKDVEKLIKLSIDKIGEEEN